MTLSRIAPVALTCLGVSLASAGAASAWTWATPGAPLLMTGGGGYGTAAYVSYSSGRLQGTYLRDTTTGDGRIYVRMYGDLGSADFKVESGRRADGGSSYAKMADTSFSTGSQYGVSQYFYLLNLCRDKPFATDPCSSTTKTHQGL